MHMGNERSSMRASKRFSEGLNNSVVLLSMFFDTGENNATNVPLEHIHMQEKSMHTKYEKYAKRLRKDSALW